MFAAASAAATINGSVTGTCGFYQGTRSNVVFSEAFTGDGTFCTDFMTGGSFIQSSTVQVGDIYATGAHNSVATAPNGYGVFVTFDETLQVSQQYLISPPVASPTPTGTVTSFTTVYGAEDGSGLGSCQTTASVNLAGTNVPEGQFTFPVTFGQPVTAVETVHIACNEYGLQSFGDEGQQTAVEGPILVYDANGNLLGLAVVTDVPEPQCAWLVALFGFWAFYRATQQRILRSS